MIKKLVNKFVRDFKKLQKKESTDQPEKVLFIVQQGIKSQISSLKTNLLFSTENFFKARRDLDEAVINYGRGISSEKDFVSYIENLFTMKNNLTKFQEAHEKIEAKIKFLEEIINQIEEEVEE